MISGTPASRSERGSGRYGHTTKERQALLNVVIVAGTIFSTGCGLLDALSIGQAVVSAASPQVNTAAPASKLGGGAQPVTPFGATTNNANVGGFGGSDNNGARVSNPFTNTVTPQGVASAPLPRTSTGNNSVFTNNSNSSGQSPSVVTPVSRSSPSSDADSAQETGPIQDQDQDQDQDQGTGVKGLDTKYVDLTPRTAALDGNQIGGFDTFA